MPAIITNSLTGENFFIRDRVKYNNTARVSSVATLDGSVAVSHYGTSDADSPVQISTLLSDSDRSALLELFRDGTSVFLALPSGVYSAYIYRFKDADDGKTQMVFTLAEHLSGA